MHKKISELIVSTEKPYHNSIDFVNTNLVGDIKLFIDPVLIETGNTSFCKKANEIISDFFKELAKAYYITNKESDKKYLLKHAKEINDTHLGYAEKYGRGNTQEGLYEIFRGIDSYISSIKINNIFELALYVPGFAEDGMSDLLTNILYKELSEFTVEQCKKRNIEVVKCSTERFYWDVNKHKWEKYSGDSLVINGNVHLLVPKEIVQSHYRFTTDNFLRMVIVENICEASAVFDENGKKSRPSKDKVRKTLLEENGSVYETVIKFIKEDKSLMQQYQSFVKSKYQSLKISDEELDRIVYRRTFRSNPRRVR